jgi:soluble lytic murein transglycosylase-like protein
MNEIDPNLTRAMIYVESAGDPQAVSHKGARGLMQLMPATASDMGVSNPLDPAQNIFGGTRYIQSLVKRFGSVDLALWAYNAGPELVKRKKLPSETRRYIPEVIRIKKILDRGGT